MNKAHYISPGCFFAQNALLGRHFPTRWFIIDLRTGAELEPGSAAILRRRCALGLHYDDYYWRRGCAGWQPGNLCACMWGGDKGACERSWWERRKNTSLANRGGGNCHLSRARHSIACFSRAVITFHCCLNQIILRFRLSPRRPRDSFFFVSELSQLRRAMRGHFVLGWFNEWVIYTGVFQWNKLDCANCTTIIEFSKTHFLKLFVALYAEFPK